MSTSSPVAYVNAMFDSDTATVTLVGEICRTPADTNVAGGPERLKNTDPNTTNPSYVQRVEHIDGRWYVAFPDADGIVEQGNTDVGTEEG